MGMRYVNFAVDLRFDTDLERWRSEQILLWKLMILTLRNYWYLCDNPNEPKLYDSGMVYMLPEQLEHRPSGSQLRDFEKFLKGRMRMSTDEVSHHLALAKGVEMFRDIPRMKEHGGGDCDNWAAARAAELCVAGLSARPYLVGRQEGSRTIYHAKVLHKDGSDEDPSIIMGMGGPDKRLDRVEECRKNYERYDNFWQQAKQMIRNGFPVERAQELKDKIDSFGFLPKDGVFRVNRPVDQVVGVSRPSPVIGYMELRAAA